MSEGENPRADPWTQAPERSSPPAEEASTGGQWPQAVLEKVLLESVREQRRARRWGIVFKSLLFVYLFALLFAYLADRWSDVGIGAGRHTALVEVEGVIAAEQDASADRVVGGLRAAFEDDRTAGVIVRVNSPGGSPVQAGYIYEEIRRLRAKYPDTPLYAVITDICASGGYYVAAAADRIFANRASLVGSIGVRTDGFGFVEAMRKLGVERRLLTAGENKGFLDPFSPLKDEEVEHLQSMLDELHQQFIGVVREGRGERLRDADELFSGLIWTGERSVELGLVDGLASAGEVARDVIGEEKIRDFTLRDDLLRRIVDRIGLVLVREIGAWMATPTLR